jgi:hypothetical protein
MILPVAVGPTSVRGPVLNQCGFHKCSPSEEELVCTGRRHELHAERHPVEAIEDRQ